jgi:hypothetical protein
MRDMDPFGIFMGYRLVLRRTARMAHPMDANELGPSRQHSHMNEEFKILLRTQLAFPILPFFENIRDFNHSSVILARISNKILYPVGLRKAESITERSYHKKPDMGSERPAGFEAKSRERWWPLLERRAFAGNSTCPRRPRRRACFRWRYRPSPLRWTRAGQGEFRADAANPRP